MKPVKNVSLDKEHGAAAPSHPSPSRTPLHALPRLNHCQRSRRYQAPYLHCVLVLLLQGDREPGVFHRSHHLGMFPDKR